MKILKFKIIIVISIISNSILAQYAGFVNNGSIINIESGAYVYVNDFINNQVGGNDGSINLDGDLYINGDVANYSGGNVFFNIEPVPDGNVLLYGINQAIKGNTPIFFENLKVKNFTKTLFLNNCEVKGILSVDGAIDLNHNRLIIDNKAQNAITYLSGFIKSESVPQYGLGEIEWRMGNSVGTFSVPFGTGAGTNDLNLTLKTNTAADPANGSIVFATYPTDAFNKPYPNSVFSLDTFKPECLADRYWKIEPVFTTKPGIKISFKYTVNDVDQTDNPNMHESKLKAIRYNNIMNKWIDMPMTGTCDLANKTVTTNDISSNNFYTYWTLSEFKLKIPNAFTPDDDGKNDVFLKGYELKILNRWGQILYEGNEGWNGTFNGEKVSPGTYYYIVTIPDYDNNSSQTFTGVITLVSKQL